jgi:hypothetical protein
MIGNRITCGIVIFAVALFFKETRGSVLLSRKAHALNQWYEELEADGYAGLDIISETGEKVESRRIRWKVKSDEERESIAKMIGISCYRPFRKFDKSIKKGGSNTSQTYCSQNLSCFGSRPGSLSLGPFCIFSLVLFH